MPPGAVTSTDQHPILSRYSGIIGTGQSLSVGFQAPLPKDTEPVQNAFRLHDSSDTYDITSPEASSLSLHVLTEPFRPCQVPSDQYPGNLEGKTPHTAFALTVTKLCLKAGLRAPWTVHSACGKNGAPMWEICKDGTCNSYEASIFEATALTRLCKEQNARLEYDAILLTHGETDSLLGQEQYASEAIKLRNAYCDDLMRVTGQRAAPIMILSQQHSFPFSNDTRPCPVTHDQWAVQATSDDKVVCAGPKYQYEYAEGSVHLSGSGYDRLGEKYAQVYFETVVKKGSWKPLAPVGVVLVDGQKINVKLHVPVAPLQWDTTLPKVHADTHKAWAAGRGFEVRDVDGKEVAIEGVEIVDEDTVEVQLAQAQEKSKMPLWLAHAMTPDKDEPDEGRECGRLGYLCDSDRTRGSSERTLRAQLETGSTEIACLEGWEDNALYDVIAPLDGDLELGEYSIVARHEEAKSKALLNTPWKGSSGWRDVWWWHNQQNYCVAFSLPIAYPFVNSGAS